MVTLGDEAVVIADFSVVVGVTADADTDDFCTVSEFIVISVEASGLVVVDFGDVGATDGFGLVSLCEVGRPVEVSGVTVIVVE